MGLEEGEKEMGVENKRWDGEWRVERRTCRVEDSRMVEGWRQKRTRRSRSGRKVDRGMKGGEYRRERRRQVSRGGRWSDKEVGVAEGLVRKKEEQIRKGRRRKRRQVVEEEVEGG